MYAELAKLEISLNAVRQILRSLGSLNLEGGEGNHIRSRRKRKAAKGMMLRVNAWELCLSKRRVLGPMSVYSQKFSTSTDYRGRYMPIGTRSFGAYFKKFQCQGPPDNPRTDTG